MSMRVKRDELDGLPFGALIHHSYPTLSDYIDHMNRYSSLGAEMVVASKGKVRFSFINIVLRPLLTFIYNYFFRLGFLDGREGLLLHLYHAVYVSWKYAKAWELSRKQHRGTVIVFQADHRAPQGPLMVNSLTHRPVVMRRVRV